MSNEYKMPAVEVGDLVHWYPGGEKTDNPHVAMVTSVGPETVYLNVFARNTYNLLLRDGVRHLSDPRRRVQELIEAGAWDHTPQHKRLLDLKARVEALEKQRSGK